MRGAKPRPSQSDKMMVTAQQFGSKFQTKSAIHRFLTCEVGAILPPEECLTMYFMRDLVIGRKKCKSPTPCFRTA